MSVFQLQDWWSVKVADNEEFDHGCLIVGNIDNSSPAADKIAVGSFQGMFRMYAPSKPQFKVEDLVLEENIGLPILQLLLGKFIPSADVLGVAVLHPKRLSVYEICPQGVKDGRINYYQMQKAYSHDLGIEGKHFTAYNMTSGTFGGVNGREMFIVQSMDGKLMIFEQSANAFTRQLVDCLIPGPIAYVPKVDGFVTVNYARSAECYRYQVLASSQAEIGAKEEFKSNGKGSFGLTSIRSAMVEWSLLLGEPCRQIVEGVFSPAGESANNNSSRHRPSELLMLCDRSIFLLKGETGGLIQQKRLERCDASCVCAYPTGGSAMNFILAGQDATLQVYSGFNLVWAARCSSVPVQMAVSSFGSQQGLIVTLDDSGGLAVSYLGTKPPINSVVSHVREMNYDKIDEEHRALLQIIRESQSETKAEPSERLIIRSQLGKTLDGERATGLGDVQLPTAQLVPCYVPPGTGSSVDNQFTKVCVRVYLSYSGAQPATDVSLVVSAPDFIFAVPKNIVLQKVSGVKTTPIMVKVYLYATKAVLPSSLDVTITATYTSAKGEPRVTSHTVAAPFYLAVRPKAPVKSALCKLILDTEELPAQPLTDLFDDLLYAAQQSGLDVSEVVGSNATQALGFQYFSPVTGSSSLLQQGSTSAPPLSSVVSVLVSKNAGRYRVQGDSYPALYLVTSELERRLNAKLAAGRSDNSSGVSVVKCADPLPMEDYFTIIQAHFQTRQRINDLTSQLNDASQQFRTVQKRLLARFKDRNPAPLAGLDFLLKETYNKIISLGDSLQEQQGRLKQQSFDLDCFSRLIAAMAAMKYSLSRGDRQLLQSYLCPDIKDGAEQGWEETVNASVMFLLKTALAKNVKESASLQGTSMEIPSSIDPLKKHLLIMMDRLEKGGKISLPAPSPSTGGAAASGPSASSSGAASPSTSAKRK